MSNENWDDHRTFLAVARAGSLAGAGRVLGVDHSTVFRRLRAFEARIGVRLFDRLPSGYALTLSGEEMARSVELVDRELADLGRRLQGLDLRPAGTVRLTTTDSIALHGLASKLAGFRRAYPDITVELTVSQRFASLTRREADIALRPTNAPEEHLIGRRLAKIAFAVYGSKSYLDGRPPVGDHLVGHDVVGYDEALVHLAAARWLDARPGGRMVARCEALTGQLACVRAGLGLAHLPCHMGDAEAELVRVLPPDPAMATGLWLLPHADLRRTGRVRALADFLAGAYAEDRDLLEGRAPYRPPP